MKAKIKGWKKSVNNATDFNGFEIEADSIEIVEEKKKRLLREGDCGIGKDNRVCIVHNPLENENNQWREIGIIEYQEVAHLFNLLDLVAEMGKAKDGKAERANDTRNQNS